MYSTVIRKITMRDSYLVLDIKSKCSEGKRHCRVRKEFTKMTISERCRYIDGVKRVSTEAPFKTEYKNLLCLHKKYFTKIHGERPEYFFPWHRWFILQYENLLRKVDCKITVPYWDWTADAMDPFQSEVWDAYSGFGGDGDEKIDYEVDSGPFKSPVWIMIPDTEEPFYLQRHFNKTARYYTATDVQESLLEPVFVDFSDNVETTYHNEMHSFIGGIMGDRRSAWAPEFFLHHGFIDKIWADWQAMSPKNNADMMRFFECHDTKLIGTKWMKSTSVVDLKNQPGNICVKFAAYDDLPLTKLRGEYINRALYKELVRVFDLRYDITKRIARYCE